MCDKPANSLSAADVLFLGMVAGGCLDLYKLESEKSDCDTIDGYPQISFDPNPDGDVNTNWAKINANAAALARLHQACQLLVKNQGHQPESECDQKQN